MNHLPGPMLTLFYFLVGWFLVLGATLGDAQVLILALHSSGITPDRAQGTFGMLWLKSWPGCSGPKIPHLTIPLAHPGSIWNRVLLLVREFLSPQGLD